MSVRLFQDNNALDSLRNSDFDSVSAFGEVIDNSIQANATNVRIRATTERKRRTYEQIETLAFGDDGAGMSSETLHRCLQIGWSSRYNERDGIGRFGVGMTMAAIHECLRVDVYSCEKGGSWHHTYIDLKEIASDKQGDIPKPKKKKLPKEFASMVGEEHGTLVLWSKYDRQSDSWARLKTDAVTWIGRTYRYFIWDGVKIFLDGEQVLAIDPLYTRTKGTRFPDDPKAKAFDPITIEWPVDGDDTPDGAPEMSDIEIRLSLLPPEFRPKQGTGDSKSNVSRSVDLNEGVSILRNKREVFYGHIPHWARGDARLKEIDRWWGCEIHFEANLDRAFTVKNIKRGALPTKQLKEALKERIEPTRQHCLEQVRALWKAAALEARTHEGEDGVPRAAGHEAAELIAKNTPVDSSEVDKDKDFEKESAELINRLGEQFDEADRAKLKALFQSQPFTILEKTWRGPQLIESNHLGGTTVLEYNMAHPFFTTVYAELDGLEDDTDGGAARTLKELIDLLLIAYATAEARFPRDAKVSVEDFSEVLRNNWGQYLKSYVRTWSSERGNDAS